MGGKGAARVFEHDGDAILLERATGKNSLLELVEHGQDMTASRILCRVAAQLHAPRHRPSPALVPLLDWFGDLETAARQHGGILTQSANMAQELLANPEDICVLHGDLHHENVLDFGERGWLAIDPKGLVGERAFDFANILCNPSPAVALVPGRLVCQVNVIAQAARLEQKRLLQWVLTWAGLSATWLMLDGIDPGATLAIATLAASELT